MVGRFNLFGPWIVDAQKDPLSTPNYIGFVLFVALVAVSASLGVEATRADRAVAVCGVGRGDRAGTLLDDADLRGVLRVRDPLDAAAGRLVGRHVRVVVLAHVAGASPRLRRHRASIAQCCVAAGMPSHVLCALTGIGVARAATAEVPYQRDSAITGRWRHSSKTSLDPTKRYQINEVDPVALGSVAFGLALELEKNERPPRRRRAVGRRWGDAIPCRRRRAGRLETVVRRQPAVIDAFTALPGAVVQGIVRPA